MAKNLTKILNNNWSLYLSRPYNLFTGSIWYHWYESKHWTKFFGIKPPTSLLIESETGIITQYWLKKEMENYYRVRKDIILKKRQKVLASLRMAEIINKQAVKIINSKKPVFASLKEAVDFLCEVAFYGTILPFAILETINKYNINDKNLIKLAQNLRKTSYYTDIQERIVIPLTRAEKNIKLREKNLLNLISYYEFIKKDISKIASRRELRNQKHYFLNYYKNGEEKIFWLKNPQKVIKKINQIHVKCLEIIGQTAFAGRASGTARVMFNPRQKTIFNEGDILITVNSNPSYIPYINKCSALITDEGGIMCHA